MGMKSARTRGVSPESAEKDVAALDRLFHEVGAYRKSADFEDLLKFVRKFPYIAPYNALLIHIQKPGSQYVLSASQWLKLYNRTVKPGARPLVILIPFEPVRFVFELGDTEGSPFPDELLNPFKPKGEISKKDFDSVLRNLPCDGVEYVEADLGSGMAGCVEDISKGNRLQSCRKKTVKVLFTMKVNKNRSREEIFATIVHELAHIYCGHLGSYHQEWLPDRSHISLNEREFEAESVAWLVCERLGLKNPSAEYLSGYLNEHGEIPSISLECVLKAAGRIESMTANSLSARKELLADTH